MILFILYAAGIVKFMEQIGQRDDVARDTSGVIILGRCDDLIRIGGEMADEVDLLLRIQKGELLIGAGAWFNALGFERLKMLQMRACAYCT